MSKEVCVLKKKKGVNLVSKYPYTSNVIFRNSVLLPDDTFILSFGDTLIHCTRKGVEINKIYLYGDKQTPPEEGEPEYTSVIWQYLYRVGEDTVARTYEWVTENHHHISQSSRRCMKLWNYKTNSVSKEIYLNEVSVHQQWQNPFLMRRNTTLGKTDQTKKVFVYDPNKRRKTSIQTPSFLFAEPRNFIAESRQTVETQFSSQASEGGSDSKKIAVEDAQKFLFVSSGGVCTTRVFSQSLDFDTLDEEEKTLSKTYSDKKDFQKEEHSLKTNAAWTPPHFFGDRPNPNLEGCDYKQLRVFGSGGVDFISILSIATLSNGETLFVYSCNNTNHISGKLGNECKMLSMNVSNETNLVHYESTTKIINRQVFVMELQNGLILGSDLKTDVCVWNRKGKLLLCEKLLLSMYSIFQLSDGTLAFIKSTGFATYYDLMYSEETLVNMCCSSVTEDLEMNPETIFSREFLSEVLPSELCSLCEDFSVGVSRKNA